MRGLDDFRVYEEFVLMVKVFSARSAVHPRRRCVEPHLALTAAGAKNRAIPGASRPDTPDLAIFQRFSSSPQTPLRSTSLDARIGATGAIPRFQHRAISGIFRLFLRPHAHFRNDREVRDLQRPGQVCTLCDLHITYCDTELYRNRQDSSARIDVTIDPNLHHFAQRLRLRQFRTRHKTNHAQT